MRPIPWKRFHSVGPRQRATNRLCIFRLPGLGQQSHDCYSTSACMHIYQSIGERLHWAQRPHSHCDRLTARTYRRNQCKLIFVARRRGLQLGCVETPPSIPCHTWDKAHGRQHQIPEVFLTQLPPIRRERFSVSQSPTFATGRSAMSQCLLPGAQESGQYSSRSPKRVLPQGLDERDISRGYTEQRWSVLYRLTFGDGCIVIAIKRAIGRPDELNFHHSPKF